jgi:transcriptional regulator with XRE-family HTH domain
MAKDAGKVNRDAALEAERARAAVAANVKAWREKAKLSQSGLSRATDVSISYISMIERGERFPQPEVLIAIAFATGKERWTDAFKTVAQ